MKEWSPAWISSKQPKKQRKFRYNAPLSVKQKFLHSHLSKELRKKYDRRALRVRKGDKVLIVRGNFKKITGKVERVDTKHLKIYVEKAEVSKRDGSKALYPIDPSNVIITELVLSDKERVKVLERKKPKTDVKHETKSEKPKAEKNTKKEVKK
nr:50S ribosomal protein L24P [uncultured archaeon]